MTLAELKALLGTTSSLVDSALQTLLTAALEAIDGRYGGGDDGAAELLRASGPLLGLSRPARDIISVSERLTLSSEPVVLTADDYELMPSGTLLMRLFTGTNPSHSWRGQVDVRYWPFADAAERDRVTVALVKLDLTFTPGLMATTIGGWSESYQSSQDGQAYQAERETILASLREAFVGA